MATEMVSDQAAPARREAWGDVMFGAEHKLALVNWIVQARAIVESVHWAATHHPEFERVLEERGVGGYGLDWDEREQDALVQLIYEAQARVSDLVNVRAAERASDASAKCARRS